MVRAFDLGANLREGLTIPPLILEFFKGGVEGFLKDGKIILLPFYDGFSKFDVFTCKGMLSQDFIRDFCFAQKIISMQILFSCQYPFCPH